MIRRSEHVAQIELARNVFSRLCVVARHDQLGYPYSGRMDLNLVGKKGHRIQLFQDSAHWQTFEDTL
jgi:hypothetical protein